MKKIICCFIALLSLGQISWAYDFSYTYQGQTLYYNIIGNVAQVTHQNYPSGYSNLTGVLIIPDSVTYGGHTYPVNSIGADAFRSCTGLTSVTIPEGITYIGNKAFAFCSDLITVNIPVGVTYIGDNAFNSCESLVTVSIPNNVYHIGNGAFSFCKNLTSIIIPDEIADIGDQVLSGCTNLMNAVYTNSCFIFLPESYSGSYAIPSGITKICGGAFYGCNNLTSVTLPNSTISIGNYAFAECLGLTTLFIPNSVNSIGNGAFLDVRHVEYHGSATGSPWDAISVNGVVDGDFVFTDYSKHYLEAYLGIGGSATIPSTVDTIGNKAFYACRELNSVIIPNGVVSIGNSVFYYCTNMTNISIPNSVNSIGSFAFEKCTGMASISIPDGVTSINSYAFYHVRHIEYHGNATGSPWGAISMNGVVDDNFVFPDSTKHHLLAYIGNEDTVVIPSTVDSIGDWAFYGCTAMVSVFIPTSVTSIGAWSFYGCDSLKVVRMNPVTPPSLGNINSLSDRTIDIVVPHTFYAAYTNAGDNYSRHRIYRDTVFVTVNSNDTNRGYVYGYNSVYPYPLYLDTITLTAIPNYGYHFARWEDYTTDNIRILSGVMQDIVLTAYFDYNQYTIMLSVDTSIHGTVSGIGSYNYLSNRTIMANAKYGYHFTHWSDGDTNNPRIIALTQDTSFTAFFGRNQYSITTLSSDTLKGTAYGSDSAYYLDTMTVIAVANYGYKFYRWEGTLLQGNYQRTGVFYGDTLNIALIGEIVLNAIFLPDTFNLILDVDTSIHGTVNGAGSFNYLSERTINATANYGYHFTHWSDGDTNNPRTLILTQDTHLVAYYDKNIYTLTFQSDNTDFGIVNTTSVSGEYLDSTMLIYTTPISHYHFTQWNDGNTENPRKFVFNDNRTYTASFAIDVHAVSVQVDNLAHGSVSGAGSREYGQPITVAATPYSGYQFTHWSDGSTYNPYTFAVLEDKALTAIFVADGEPWHDTVVLYDTTYMVLHDTTYIDVHDTTYVNAHDTSYVYVHDTTETVVVDTMIVNHYIYDTGTVVIIDTFVVDHYIYDTVTLHDTSYVDVPVHDTTEIVVVDTVIVNHYIYDTGTVVIIDTFIVSHYIHDTTTVTVWDTVTQNIYVHDTTILNNYIHDTMYVDIYIHDTVPQVVYDTVIQTVFDTVTNTEYVFDTVTNTVYDTVINTEYLFDTVTVTDSMWVYDTLWLYDTIVIHDTIYIPQEGIGDVEGSPVKVYQSQGQIVVEGADGQPVALYDVSGRLLATRRSEEVQGGTPLRFSIRASGTYLIKVGNVPARRIVVLR